MICDHSDMHSLFYFHMSVLQIMKMRLFFLYTLFYYRIYFMMDNTQIKLDSCLIGIQILNNYPLNHEQCGAVFFYKRCAIITPKNHRLINCRNINYH